MSIKGIGRLVQLGLAKEAVRGTAEAAATFWVPFLEASVEEKLEKAVDEQSQGVIEPTTDSKIVKQFAEISLKGNVPDKSLGLILLATLGSISSAAESAPNALAYDHTFSVAQSIQHQSLTAFINDPLAAADYKHALGCINSLDISYQAGKLIEMDLKMLAKKGATATLTPAANTENIFTPKNFSFKLASTVAGLGAASAVSIRSMKLKIAKGLESDDVLGSNDPADFLNKSIEITGEIEAIWQDEASFKTAFLAGTQQAMRIDLKNTDVTIATSANPEVKIDLYKVSFDALTRPFKVGDTVMQTLSFKAHYSITDTKMISVVLTNLQASY